MTVKRMRNITNGQVVISVDDEDKITTDEDLPEYFDTSIETMRENPNKTESYLENIRTGKFSMIHARTVDKLVQYKDLQVEKKKEDDTSNNSEKILQDMITSVHQLLDKIFVFFMGILPGLAFLHVFLLNQDQANNLANYSKICLRINQVEHFLLLICAVGSIYLYNFARRQVIESFRKQESSLAILRGLKVKRLIAMVLYLFIYLVELVIHIFVAILSNTIDERGSSNDENYFYVLLGLNILITVISSICWCILIQNTSSNQGSNIHRVFTNVQTNVYREEEPEEEEVQKLQSN